MAAITACLLDARQRGGHVVALHPVYGTTEHLLQSGLTGLDVSWCDASEVGAALRPDTSLVLMETSSRQALCEREPHRTLSPASFVKVLTLYLAFDALRTGKINLADLVTVSQRAGQTGGNGGQSTSKSSTQRARRGWLRWQEGGGERGGGRLHRAQG